MAKRVDRYRSWITTDFRKLLYEEKAEKPDKTLEELQDDIAREFREKKKKRGGFDFPKF